MISTFRPTLTVSESLFAEAVGVIDRSGADRLIDEIHQQSVGPGGRRAAGVRYTIRAVLVSALLCVMLKRPPTVAGILQLISDFTPKQLAEVGMDGQDLDPVRTSSRAEYARLHAFLARRLAPIDPDPDLPARRITNEEHQQIVRRRSREQKQASHHAAELLSKVANSLVAGSVLDRAPEGCAGDLVVDESIFDLATNMTGLGVASDKRRGATPFAKPYGRDRSNKVRTDGQKAALTKSGVGIGLTALTRIGEPNRMHGVAPVIIGIDVHPPTSGDAGAVLRALAHAKANGLTARKDGTRTRWPYLTVDMGYNSKRGFADSMVREQYAYVGRYPKHWIMIHDSLPATEGGRKPGPIMVAGDFYCPAITDISEKVTVPPGREMLASKPPGFADHDRRLQRTLPLLMGRNSRPVHGVMQRGQPSDIRPKAPELVKTQLVCPAAFGRVRCPLRPESMDIHGDVPTLEPTWTADQYSCCDSPAITVGLSPDQLRMAQFGLTPGSWEHMVYFEAARALTEQRFSILKSRSVTGLSDLTSGPRRQPMIAITLALAVVVANLSAQRSHAERRPRGESINRRMRQLQADLGYPPTRTPPRT
ncbi:hypothetical protein [Tsukamurella pseudospumae]|uniref:Uncharacterized protein n=1 Tax=Tsukamurella pseudospumae TaxID=239498 RepID=A0A138AV06_9ACTN|nr:hypothetical protein [Tsukamurella pseudospumae]KXO96116.1 hypothetical protein AXK61_23675 [Tsukamurella pseudospumae]KXP14253.1 hypothetical protein AXK60_21055 [Tsukamurella pseudospumae]